MTTRVGSELPPDVQLIADARAAELRARGWIIKPGWDRHGPVTWLDVSRRLWVVAGEGWIDHPYRLVHRKTKSVFYVSEPYVCDPDVAHVLGSVHRYLKSRSDGPWYVAVHRYLAMHYPGRTVAIVAWKDDVNLPVTLGLCMKEYMSGIGLKYLNGRKGKV